MIVIDKFLFGLIFEKVFHCDTGSIGSTSGCGGFLKNFKRLSSLVVPDSPTS